MYKMSRNGDFVRLWTGGAVSSFGSSLTTLAYPLLALGLTGSAGAAGLPALASLVAAAVMRLPVGVLVDRLSLRRVLVTSDLVRAGVTAIVVAALGSGYLTLGLLVAAAAVHGSAAAFSDTAHSVALRYVVPAAELPRAFALNDGRGHAVGLVGQPAGGYLFGWAPVLPLVADMVSFLVSASLSATIRTPMSVPTDAAADRTTLRQDLFTGLRFLVREPFLRTTLLAAAGYQLVYAGATFALVASFTARGVTPGRLGTMFALAAVGGILGAVAAPLSQARLTPVTLVVLMGGVATAAFGAFAWVVSPLVAGALLGAIAFLSAPANAMLLAAQVHRTPAVLQGRVMAAAFLLAGLVAPAGPPLAGTLLDRAGARTTFVVLAVLTAGVTVAVHRSRAMRSSG